MRTQKNLVRFLLLALLLLQISYAVDINNANCDQIVQCDNDGVQYDGFGSIECAGSTETTPLAEQVFVTGIRIFEYCDVGDDEFDCINIATDFREYDNSNDYYHGNGYDRFGGYTICCPFADETSTSVSLINDFNSDADNPISREWQLVDSSDTVKDACPIVSYNPEIPSSISFINMRNGSFANPGFNYEQHSEPGFDQAIVINLLDYFFDNETGTRERYDQVKEGLQAKSVQPSWDIFDIFSLANENHMENYLDDILPAGCEAKQIDCTSTTSNLDLCTAGTGVNIRADTEGFFKAFFNMYKTPYLSQSSHTFFYDSYGTPTSFTGSYYWETLYSYEYPYFQTYQGSRTYTNQTLGRILGDTNSGANDGVYVVCDGYVDADVWLKFDNGESYSNYTMSYGDQGHLELIKDEDYYWESDAYESNGFVTSNPYVRWDWTNNGYDTDWEEINENEHRVESNVSTSTLTLKNQVWTKGGKDTDTINYRIYNNPDIVFDWEELIQDTFTKEAYALFNVTAFGTGAYDYGEVEYACYDLTNDGVYDVIIRENDSILYDCSPVSGTADVIYGNPKEEHFSYLTTDVGLFNFKVKAGMHYKNRADYSETSIRSYQVIEPTINAIPNLLSPSWTTYVGDTISFNLDGSTSHNVVNLTAYNYESDGTFEACYSVNSGDSYGGISCIQRANPLNALESVYVGKPSVPGISSGTSILQTYIMDELGYDDTTYQTYTFRAPIISANINLIDGDYDLETGDNFTLNAVGSTSENPVHSVCWDLNGDGNDDNAFSITCSSHKCDGTISSCFELDPVTGEVTVENSDYSNGNYNVILRVWGDEGYSNTDSQSYTIRDYYNLPVINLEYSDLITDVANTTSKLIYNLEGSNIENKNYVCYDYETDSTYDVCYSQLSGQTHCGLSCTQVANVLTANIQIDFITINDLGDFTLTALSNNGESTSYATRDYNIFQEGIDISVNTIISSIINDDDLNDDFVIDLLDYQNLSREISNNETWFFNFTSVLSTPFEELEFSCWDTNLDYTGVWDVCYQVGGGYNAFCGINCTNSDWYTGYVVNNTNYDSNIIYTVSVLVGNQNGTILGQASQQFNFNPISSDEEKAVKFTIIVSVFAILLLLVFTGLFLVLFGFISTLTFTGLIRILFRKRSENKENFKKLKD